jgi:hypothetical protein
MGQFINSKYKEGFWEKIGGLFITLPIQFGIGFINFICIGAIEATHNAGWSGGILFYILATTAIIAAIAITYVSVIQLFSFIRLIIGKNVRQFVEKWTLIDKFA